ncbi:MAG: tRNA (guanosine(37)-N1)-methyltransferase TrmD [Patescibacteria group bacterium]|nr:tRNA (guanosine(37)-N1)-methyltransferase TrmD [Patescibacteria group bacterium]
MKFHIITLFPEMFERWLSASVIGRARIQKLFEIEFYQLRDFAKNKHKSVDDSPFGGGAGMVLTPQPLWDCITHVKSLARKNTPVIFFTPHGKLLNQKIVQAKSKTQEMILLCGHYEGVDQRIRDEFVDEEISVGEYVTSGGELPAMIFIDAVLRFVPGVLGNSNSVTEESFSPELDGKKEYPQYTRPADFKGMRVPEVLQSGDHVKISKWRKDNLQD